jgi:GNAT superfamily N-acetyltransferase
MILTRELDETIRRSELEGIRCGVATVQRLYPESHAASIELAGGLAAFTGVESLLSQAYGLGTLAPVTEREIATITDFYESRGARPKVFVTPMADLSLGRTLASAGYAPSEYENVLASDTFDGFALHDERIAAAVDTSEWARASTLGFMESQNLKPGDDQIVKLLASSEGFVGLQGHEDGAIVATAAMDVRGECSALFAGSTLPGYRGRGWHIAMIRDRIARARDAGVRLMRATARPSSSSERNFHRCGFETLYTRVLWERSI